MTLFKSVKDEMPPKHVQFLFRCGNDIGLGRWGPVNRSNFIKKYIYKYVLISHCEGGDRSLFCDEEDLNAIDLEWMSVKEFIRDKEDDQESQKYKTNIELFDLKNRVTGLECSLSYMAKRVFCSDEETEKKDSLISRLLRR